MTFLTNLTLGKKITLLTTLGLLLGVGIFSSLGMRAVNQATEAMLRDRLTTAQLVADYLDETLGRALSELKNVAQTIEGDGAQRDIGLKVDALEQTFSRLSIYTHGIYLVDNQGQVIWSQPEEPAVRSVNFSAYPNLARVIEIGEASISGLVSAPVTDTPVVLLATPIKGSRAEKRLLIVAIDLSQSSIGGFVQPIRLGRTGYVEIIDQNGVVVARTEPGPKLVPFEQSDHSSRFTALINAAKPTLGVCHTCHESQQTVARKDVLAFIPLAEARWGVVVRQAEEEALAPAYELRRSLLIFGAALVTMALFFVIITTRDIGSRIKMLTTASRRMADGDLVTAVTTSGKDEVGMLAQTFDEMRVKLMTSYGELEQKTKELSSLLSVSEILTSTFDLPSLLNAVTAKAVEVIPGADGGVLLLQHGDRGGLAVQSAIGINNESLPPFMLVPGSESSSKDMVERTVNAFLQSEALRSRVQSYICAEVVHRGRHVGSLILVSFRSSEAFSELDRRLLQTIAHDIAIAFERNQLAKEAEQVRALHEADRLRSQFISSVSHELRTPLTLIKGYTTSMLRQDASWDEETQREFLQIIDGKTDELRDLIDKLLQSAKLEAGAFRLEKEPVLIPRVARKVVDEMAPRAKRHNLTLEFTSSFPVVEADVRCLEQVLRNLIENAIKYSPDGGDIAVGGEVRDGNVVVSVSDKGIGIAAEHRDKIFERFYRVDSPLTRSTGGSGLGLSIVKGHVEAHGGKVWLESTVGKGSKFFFSLPLETSGDDE